jgi:hypothetical protein
VVWQGSAGDRRSYADQVPLWERPPLPATVVTIPPAETLQHRRRTEPAVPTYVPGSDESDLHNEQYNPAAENQSVDPEDERSGDPGVQ